MKSILNFFVILIVSITQYSCGFEGNFESKIRVIPTYVCEGDPIDPIIATWEHEGTKGRVRVFSNQNNNANQFCESGFREGRCVFNRTPTEADIPLIARLYKRRNELDDVSPKRLDYTVLSGTKETEGFTAEIEWSEPFDKIVNCREIDADGNSAIVQCSRSFVKIERVIWNIPRNYFSSTVLLESIKYRSGAAAIRINGPGFNGLEHIFNNTGDVRNAIEQEEFGGTWYGYLENPKEVENHPKNINGYGSSFQLSFFIRCQ